MFLLEKPPALMLLLGGCAFCSCYLVALAVYRLYLSSLAKFPGPKLAALTHWYGFYFAVILPGQFTFHIQDLHKQYGPIIRISPEELHILDPSYWQSLYGGPEPRDKYKPMSTAFGNPNNAFSTPSHHLHRLRRSALSAWFSKKQIHEVFEPAIKTKLDILCTRFAQYKNTGKVLRLDWAWPAFTGDIITKFAFDRCYHGLESPDFKDTLHQATVATVESANLVLHFPWLVPLMKSMPEWIVLKIQPCIHSLFNMQKDIRSVIIDIVTRRNRDEKDTTNPTIFHHILDSDLPAQEKAIERLVHEAQAIVSAGSETTAWALSVSSFHITNDPQVLQKLRAELSEAMPCPAVPPTWSQVEQLPYLNAVVKEAVRLSYGLATRNPRLFHTPIQYKDWIIPAGTPVSMTSVDVFQDESIFPEYRSFRPERWLDDPRTADGLPLDRYFIGFGKGGRSCLGINLAYAELHMALATVFRRFSFELYETDVSDVEMARDYSLPMPKLGSKGVRVIVRSDELSA